METIAQNSDSFLLIIDYHRHRVDDVACLRRYAYERYGLKTLLIRSNPAPHDYQIADLVIALDPRSPDFVTAAMRALAPMHHQLRSGLVFSDKAVQSGAKLLERLNLQVDNATLADGAFSKIRYRQIEAEHRSILEPQRMFIPAHMIIHNIQDLLDFVQCYPNGVVLKPACEGNNRGVIFFDAHADLQQALREVDPYLTDGIICEQAIPFQSEFSFDGLAHLSFITEKCSASGRYPVENGQILPARIDQNQRDLLTRAGQLANLLVGQSKGPFHNEIKTDTTQAAVVEPNRRPAGMKIWSLAERVYGLNLYHLWVDSVLGKPLPAQLPAPQGIAATIMLGSPNNGYLRLPSQFKTQPHHLFDKAWQSYQKSQMNNELQWFGFTMSAKTSNWVKAIPQENGDFLAQVCVYSPNSDLDILAIKNAISDCWKQAIARFIY